MPYTIAKTFRFEAAHQLHGLPEGHQCGRLHGHSYRVELILRGELDDRGFVLDYGDLRPFGDWIATNFDHHNLNDLLEQSTAEALARRFFEEASRLFGQCVTVARVYETATTWAEYTP